MKRIIAGIMVVLIAFSPLLRGLFFAVEAYVFLSVIALLSVIYFISKISNKERIHINKWLSVFGLLLIAAYIISFVNSVNVRENITALLQFSEYFIVFIIVYDYYHDKKQKLGKLLMSSVLISGFINAFIGVQALSKAFPIFDMTLNDIRLGGTFQYANTAAAYYAICVIFALALISLSKSLLLRVFLCGIGNTILLAMLLTGSRGGYIVSFAAFLFYFIIQPFGQKLKTIGAFFCIFVPAVFVNSKISALTGSKDYMALTKWIAIAFGASIAFALLLELFLIITSKLKHKRAFGALILGLISVGGVLFVLNKGLSAIMPDYIIKRFANISLYDTNIHLRLEFDEWALRLISDNWLTGRGGGAWDSLYQIVQDEFYMARFTHNHYLQVFVESGILGFISFLGLIILSLLFMVKALLRTKETAEKLLISGILSGLLLLAAHSAIDFNLTFVSLSLLLWVLIAASAVFLPQKREEVFSEKNTTKQSGSNTFRNVLVVVSSILLSLTALYALSSYNAERGYYSMLDKKIPEARGYYEEASRLDPINPVYYYQLAKIYNYYADQSTKEENETIWRNEARVSAERSIALDACYPDYRALLVQVYLKSGMPVEAVKHIEAVIKYQPLNIINYEVLARVYYETGKYYLENNENAQGKEYLLKSTEVKKMHNIEETDLILSYRQKALSLLKNQ